MDFIQIEGYLNPIIHLLRIWQLILVSANASNMKRKLAQNYIFFLNLILYIGIDDIRVEDGETYLFWLTKFNIENNNYRQQKFEQLTGGKNA